MRIGLFACCVVALPLAGCMRQPTETVVLSNQQATSAFVAPLDGRWRKASEKRPVAILIGRAETSRIFGTRRAVLEASCYRGRPRVRVAYDVGLRTGPISMAYRFDEKIVQKGVVRVRGRTRNILTVDYSATATAFLADLRTSSTLKVRASRSSLDMHDADFRWDRNDKVLVDVLTACQGRMLDTDRNRPPSDPDDDDDAIEDAIKDVLPEQQT